MAYNTARADVLQRHRQARQHGHIAWLQTDRFKSLVGSAADVCSVNFDAERGLSTMRRVCHSDTARSLHAACTDCAIRFLEVEHRKRGGTTTNELALKH